MSMPAAHQPCMLLPPPPQDQPSWPCAAATHRPALHEVDELLRPAGTAVAYVRSDQRHRPPARAPRANTGQRARTRDEPQAAPCTCQHCAAVGAQLRLAHPAAVPVPPAVSRPPPARRVGEHAWPSAPASPERPRAAPPASVCEQVTAQGAISQPTNSNQLRTSAHACPFWPCSG